MSNFKTFAAATLLALAATPALAATAPGASVSDSYLAPDRFEVRVRALGVLPDVSSNVNIGGHVSARNSYTPEVDLTYYLTERFSAELIAATSRHKLDYNNTTSLGKTWILPPTLTAQYHILPGHAFNPYVGAGLNYSMFYGEKTSPGFHGLDVDGGVGYALQAGADYWIDKHWGLNFDVKKLYLNVDAKLNGGAIRADVDLDPWIVGAGVAYHF